MVKMDEGGVTAQDRPFGAWLLEQRGVGGFIGGLANAAAQDRTFPRHGDVQAVGKWMQGQRPSGDDWEALEDAEAAWLRN